VPIAQVDQRPPSPNAGYVSGPYGVAGVGFGQRRSTASSSCRVHVVSERWWRFAGQSAISVEGARASPGRRCVVAPCPLPGQWLSG
jgi:hypothetical protein